MDTNDRSSATDTLRMPLRHSLLLASLTAALWSSSAAADPITYTGFAIANGRLGDWSFNDARVTFRIQSDTSAVQSITVPFGPSDPCDAAYVALNGGGVATVSISTPTKTVNATFTPGQIFATIDKGTDLLVPPPAECPGTPPDYQPSFEGGRGIGFGSFNAAGGFEPAYPLGIEDGSIDWGDFGPITGDGAITSGSQTTLQAMSLDLTGDAAYSGRAWICPGFPASDCQASTKALKTDKGDFFLSTPYHEQFSNTVQVGTGYPGPFYYLYDLTYTGYDQVINGALFTSELLNKGADVSAYAGRQVSNALVRPITYSAAVLSDVDLGRTHYAHATVIFSIEDDRNDPAPFTLKNSAGVVTASGYKTSRGTARVRIISGGAVVNADIAPGQLYAYIDTLNGNAGFGSVAGGLGYPLGIAGEGQDSPNLLQALKQIRQNPLAAANYSLATNAIATDLTNPTVLSGHGHSCSNFDPTIAACATAAGAPVPIRTSQGSLYLTQPFVVDSSAALDGSQFQSFNWGLFWSEIPEKRD